MVDVPLAINYFKYAQSFFLDRSLVKDANEVGITKIELYFRAKPPETNNKSGILSPGVEVTLVPVVNGVPAIEYVGAVRPTEPTEHGAKFAFYSSGSIARMDWGEIQASADASVPTSFKFEQPFFVKSNKEYAILVKFDGDEDFVLWYNKKGDFLIGTQSPSPGVSGNYVVNLFEYASPIRTVTPLTSTALNSNNAAIINNPQNAIVNPLETQDLSYIANNWQPINDTDLKFRVYVARYFNNGSAVSANSLIINDATLSTSLSVVPNTNPITISGNVVSLTAQVEPLEFILFDGRYSATRNLRYGDSVFQVQNFYPADKIIAGVRSPLTISVVANTINSDIITCNGNFVLANGSTFNAANGFNSLFSQEQNQDEYIIIVSGSEFNVRKITDVVSNTSIKIDEDVTFTNTAAYFYKAPVGFIKSVDKSYVFGQDDDVLVLYDSNANTTTRFVNNTIETVTVTANGVGYSNSDYLVITGFENINGEAQGGYLAAANIVTNATGNVTAVFVSNSGAGFVNTAWLTGSNVTVTNSSGLAVQSSVANGATFTFGVGSTLRTEFSNNQAYFANTRVVNLEAMRVKPEITVNNPLGSAFTIRHRTLYYRIPTANVQSGYAYFIGNTVQQAATDTYVKIFKSHSIGSTSAAPVIASRSNEFIIRYANGGASNTSAIGSGLRSNNAVMIFDVSSNNDYSIPFIDPQITRSHYAKYVINNDYTNEHTNYGNSWAKHVTSKVSFAKDRFAEDLLVFVTGYRPTNTDIKVYARIHNSQDPEAFDDKDWTLLELVDGNGVFSSKDNSADFVEYTYNLTQFPNTDVTLAGSATLGGFTTVTIGNNFIIGTGSNYKTSNIVFQFNANSNVDGTNDFITLSSHTFANGNQVVYVANNSNTALSGLTNNDLYFVVQANSSGIKLSATSGGANINITANGTAGAVSNGQFIVRTAVVPNDLIKVYSPLFPNTYMVGVVNNVVNATAIVIKTGFGDLSANLSGTVVVNTSSLNVVANSTTNFLADFSNGDYVAVWSNSSIYETRKINVIANNTFMNVESAFTNANNFSFYARVEANTFTTQSVTGSGLKIDRLEFKNQAFNNQNNDNVCRYYNTSMMEFDGYDSFQLKVVMLSDSEYSVPKIDDVRAIGVST